MLNKIAIKNYRSCLDTSLALHPNLSVLIGPNGSGKTNILQAIMLLAKIAQEDVAHRSRPHSEGVSSKIDASFLIDRRDASVSASMKVYPDELNRDVLADSHQHWKLRSRNGKKASTELPMALADQLAGDSDYYRYSFLMRRRGIRIDIKQPKWVINLLQDAAKFCRRIKYYGASQFTNPGSCPTSFTIDDDGRPIRTLPIRSGHGVILQKLYSASKDRSQEDFARFIQIVAEDGLKLFDALEFKEVPSSSIEYTVRVGGRLVEKKRSRLLVIPQFRIGKQTLSPNQLSEGTFKTLALLFHVITDTSSLLLIEEPEVCVHHGLLSSIVETIKSFSVTKQIVISTHSDYVLDQVKPENVIRVTRDKPSGTTASRLPDALDAREYSALRSYLATTGNLGEYWREGGLGDRQ